MASQVLSGSSNVSYTNNTGQNVRIVINFMSGVDTLTDVFGAGAGRALIPIIRMNWAGVSRSGPFVAIGRNLAFYKFTPASSSTSSLSSSGSSVSANNGVGESSGLSSSTALPTELMLAPGQTFSASCSTYNIVIIPEAG